MTLSSKEAIAERSPSKEFPPHWSETSEGPYAMCVRDWQSQICAVYYRQRGGAVAKQDTLMKALTKSLSSGALEAVGVYGVELTESLPTELPANTLRVDMAWRMQDNLLFHLEFQSKRETDLHRFLEYDVRLARHHKKKIRTVVLYHASVTMAPEELDIGTAQYRVENVFLSNLDGNAALDEVTRHLQADEWHPEDRLRLALALSMEVRDREQAFERVLALVPKVSDETERDLVVAALLTFGDKELGDAQRERLRKELRKVSKIAQELREEGREEGREVGREEGRAEVARTMLAKGMDVALVSEVTGLPVEELEQLRKELSN